MISARIRNATRVLGKSQGFFGLAVRDELINATLDGPSTPCMVTAWSPTPKELEALNAGAVIYVKILGTQHPPIRVETGEAPE